MFKKFTPIWGFMIQIDEHIFRMGWNHQPGMDFCSLPKSPTLQSYQTTHQESKPSHSGIPVNQPLGRQLKESHFPRQAPHPKMSVTGARRDSWSSPWMDS